MNGSRHTKSCKGDRVGVLSSRSSSGRWALAFKRDGRLHGFNLGRNGYYSTQHFKHILIDVARCWNIYQLIFKKGRCELQKTIHEQSTRY